MPNDFSDCLKSGKIAPFSRGRALAGKELRLAREDFRAANESLQSKNFRWSTIQAYYAMFHAARALLYAKNYREKSHWCLIEAIRTLYVDAATLPGRYLQSLVQAKHLREAADYYGDFNQENTVRLIEQAKEFLAAVAAIVAPASQSRER